MIDERDVADPRADVDDTGVCVAGPVDSIGLRRWLDGVLRPDVAGDAETDDRTEVLR